MGLNIKYIYGYMQINLSVSVKSVIKYYLLKKKWRHFIIPITNAVNNKQQQQQMLEIIAIKMIVLDLIMKVDSWTKLKICCNINTYMFSDCFLMFSSNENSY